MQLEKVLYVLYGGQSGSVRFVAKIGPVEGNLFRRREAFDLLMPLHIQFAGRRHCPCDKHQVPTLAQDIIHQRIHLAPERCPNFDFLALAQMRWGLQEEGR